MKLKIKYLSFLILFSMLSTIMFPSKVQAADSTDKAFPQEAIYDLTIGGKQEFVFTDLKGNIINVIISEQPAMSKISNGTYKVSYTSTGCWKASYYVVISGNSISKAYSPSYETITGLITYSCLVKESSKQVSYYLLYQLNAYSLSTGIRSVISGTDLRVFPI